MNDPYVVGAHTQEEWDAFHPQERKAILSALVQSGNISPQEALSMSDESAALGKQYQAEIDRELGVEDIIGLGRKAAPYAQDIAPYLIPGGGGITSTLSKLLMRYFTFLLFL